MQKMLAQAFLGHSLTSRRLALETAAVVAAYWLMATAANALFSSWGIMPMPISFPAGLALIFAVLRGWQSAPGIFIGTIVANVSAFGAPIAYAMCVGLANCMGAIAGGLIVRQYIMRKNTKFGFAGVLFCFFVTLVIPPVISASGGMSCKWLLGLIPYGQFAIGWMKWVIAHTTGILLVGLPVLAWLAIKEAGR
ncbi:MASE1 domain-containing protein [Desulfobulbus rhabdoformis]|uniref:MASE1 domain-containing protein n=1 Tax=Desulfobulbus rhabdoformis TaxID=34032 RepID=UPI001966BF33|nr:MASE1 domain-containing protein [Desulfobulbus rhabdoformis]MBM9616767.1 MASE1 domain-containing protein [Desulfobulbus rhabdoformis]